MNPNHIIHSEVPFHPDPLGDISPNRPLRVGYLTTMKEIYGDAGGEFVGRQPFCEEQGRHLDEIRVGNLQALSNAIRDNIAGLGDSIEIAFVGYSDRDRTLSRLGIQQDAPFEQGNWPWPHDLPGADGRKVHEHTHQVTMYTPAYLRARKAAMNAKDQVEKEKAQLEMDRLRREAEQNLVDLMMNAGVDFVITDSLTYIFQAGMPVLHTFANRIINFHPAITRGDTALPGLYPTSSAIARFRRGVRFGEGGREVPVPELRGSREHGATVHMTIPEIDAGEVVYSAADPEMIRDGETQQTLRTRSFQHGHGVLVEGVRRFTQYLLRLQHPVQQIEARPRLVPVS